MYMSTYDIRSRVSLLGFQLFNLLLICYGYFHNKKRTILEAKVSTKVRLHLSMVSYMAYTYKLSMENQYLVSE